MALVIERVLDTFFEFVWDGGDAIMDSAPSATFIGNECRFKTKNGALIIKDQKVLVNQVTVIDTFGGSGTFNYNNVPQLVLKLLELNFFQDRVSLNVVGATRFDALLDAFGFFGHDGKVPVVDEDQNKLVPTVFHNISLLTGLLDVSIDELVAGTLLGVESINDELKFTLVDGGTSTSNNETSLRRVEVIAEEGQTQIVLDENPNVFMLYKNGAWQIKGDGKDFNHNTASKTTTLHYAAKEGDYFEYIFGGGMRLQQIEATANGQIEWVFDGNPAIIVPILNGFKLREGVDYERTIFSNNNKVTLINQDFINTIKTGDILDLILN